MVSDRKRDRLLSQRHLPPDVLAIPLLRRKIRWSLALAICSVLSSLVLRVLAPADMNDLAGTFSHLCQIVAICFACKAFYEIGWTRPYDRVLGDRQLSMEALQIILDSVPAWIVYKDTQNRLLRVNKAFATIMGMPPEQLEGRSLFDLYPRQQAEAYWRDDREVIASGKPRTNIIEPVQIGSEERWVQTDKIPYRDPQGNIIGIICFSVEITDRKLAEEALKKSEEGLRLVLEASGVGWWSLDLTSREVTSDERCKTLLGLPPTAKPSGALFRERVLPEDRPPIERNLAEARLRPGYSEAECRTVLPDGSIRWLLIKGRAYHDIPGRPFIKGIVMDVTERKQSVEALKQAQEILKLAHDEQLQRHQAELAHVARLSMMGEMAATLAHELNQPLHAVKNYAFGSLCRLEGMPQKDEGLLFAMEQISEEANRAAEIIRRVKGFVQKRDTRFSNLSLNSLVEEAVLLTRMEVERCRAKVVLELAEDLPDVVGDAIQIEQVILNLVRNALEAMNETPDGQRLLTIKTTRRGDDTVEVAVCDRGKGITEAHLEKVFEPFFTTKPEGMGMGLAISRSILQTHRGRLWATANRTQGCAFQFTLPISKGN